MSETSRLIHIRHVTGFRYEGFAESSYNEARMTPLTLSNQRVVSSSLSVEPFAVQSTYRDYFDTIVTTFDLHEPHRRLEVVAEATVETFADDAKCEARTLSELHESDAMDRYVEFLTPTARTRMSRDVLTDLRAATSGRHDVSDVVASIMNLVVNHVDYVKGVTQVSSTAEEVWDEGRGVCQDLSHVMISMMRAVGIPARYVSGYLHSQDGAALGETILGESHAWVEYYCGQWRGVDPTNRGAVGLGHVAVAKGREYGDVPPLKGIYHGGTSSASGVVVEMTRMS